MGVSYSISRIESSTSGAAIVASRSSRSRSASLKVFVDVTVSLAISIGLVSSASWSRLVNTAPRLEVSSDCSSLNLSVSAVCSSMSASSGSPAAALCDESTSVVSSAFTPSDCAGVACSPRVENSRLAGFSSSGFPPRSEPTRLTSCRMD